MDKPSLTPEQRVESLAADIKKPGMTTGKATLAAQELYEASAQYDPDQETMLDAYQPGQDPKRFAAGFQNAYILGTLGEHSALGDSKAAAYLTEQQRELAYEMGLSSAAQETEMRATHEESELKDKYRVQNLPGHKPLLETQSNQSIMNRNRIGLQFFAQMPESKFTSYALNPDRAPDKAKAFETALGYNLSNYSELMQNVMENIDESRFVEKGDLGYGMRYEYIVELEGPNGKRANVLTAWIQDGNDKRLTSIYVTEKQVTK